MLIDCVTSPPTDAMRAAGVTGVSRYLSWADARDTLRKVIHQAEYDRLRADGFDVLLNWEYAATDWLGGAAAGAAHAAEAVRQARALGYPAGNAIPGSADFDMTKAQWDGPCWAYARAYSQGVRGGGYRAGVYGPYDVLDWCATTGWFDIYWQAGMSTAWSGGRNARQWPGAHLRQRYQTFVGGVDCDVNDILQADYGQQAVDAASTGDTMALADEHLTSAPSVTALQALDDLWSMEYLGHSGIGGPTDVHFLNRQLNSIQQAIAALTAAPATVTMTDADRQAIADLVAAQLPKPPTAAEIADELARRMQA